MPITHTYVSAAPPVVGKVDSTAWNDTHTVSIVNADVDAGAAIDESKLNLNYPTHALVTLGTASGLSLVGQVLSLGLASSGVTGALSGTDWDTFNNKQSALTLPLSAANGGTGISNAGTITNASNTTITGGGTLALGGFTLTIPATGTAALLGTANVFTAQNQITISTTTDIALVLKTSNDNTTKKLQEWRSSADAVLASMSASGQLVVGQATDGASRINILGGVSGQDMLTLTRTVGVTQAFSFSMNGGGLAFRDLTHGNVIPFTLVGATTSGTIIIGSNGKSSGTPISSELWAEFMSAAAGSNIAANTFTMRGGGGTGTGTTGNIVFSTGNTGASGTTAHTYTNRVFIYGDGGMAIIGGSDKVQTIIKAHSTQTANLQEWQNSSGTVLASVLGSGILKTGGRRQKITTTAINYVALTTDEIIVCTAGVTITLPVASGTGQTYRIVARTSGTLTIDGNGTDTIKGELTQTLTERSDLIITDTASGIWE